jgi:hypothetical protein
LLADLVEIKDGLIRHSPEKVRRAIVDIINKTRLIRGRKFHL